MQTTQQCAEDRDEVIGLEKKHQGANFKGKGDIQECKKYRGIQLLTHTCKLWARVMNEMLRECISILES